MNNVSFLRIMQSALKKVLWPAFNKELSQKGKGGEPTEKMA